MSKKRYYNFLTFEGDDGKEHTLSFDKIDGKMLYNGDEVITRKVIQLGIEEKWLARIVALSTFIAAIAGLIAAFK